MLTAIQRADRLRGIDAGRLEQRGGEVGEHDRRVARAAGRDDAGPTNEQRFAQATFVEVALAGAKRPVVRRGSARKFQDVQPAVVARENENRPIGQAERFDLRHQPPNGIVERFDHRGIGGVERVLMLLDQFRGGGQRNVWVVMRHITEERPVAMVFDEFLRGGGDREFRFAAARQCRLRIGRGRHGHVKALLLGPEAGAAEMPLAE